MRKSVRTSDRDAQSVKRNTGAGSVQHDKCNYRGYAHLSRRPEVMDCLMRLLISLLLRGTRNHRCAPKETGDQKWKDS